jgi:hypothetical protein
LVAYEIYRGPKNQYGKIPGVLGRSEFSMEVMVEIAHFVDVIGMPAKQRHARQRGPARLWSAPAGKRFL